MATRGASRNFENNVCAIQSQKSVLRYKLSLTSRWLFICQVYFYFCGMDYINRKRCSDSTLLELNCNTPSYSPSLFMYVLKSL